MRKILTLITVCTALVALSACRPAAPPEKEVVLVVRAGAVSAWGTNVVDVADAADEAGCLDGGVIVDATWTGKAKTANTWPFKVDGYSKPVGLDFDIPFGVVSSGCVRAQS